MNEIKRSLTIGIIIPTMSDLINSHSVKILYGRLGAASLRAFIGLESDGVLVRDRIFKTVETVEAMVE